MKNATLETEILIETPNEVGIAGHLFELIAKGANVNIKTMWAGVINGKGNFAIITDNNNKVEEVLKNSDFSNFKEEEVLVIRAPDKKGICAELSNKIAGAGININYIYTTVFGKDTAVVFSTDDNQQALTLFE